MKKNKININVYNIYKYVINIKILEKKRKKKIYNYSIRGS